LLPSDLGGAEQGGGVAGQARHRLRFVEERHLAPAAGEGAEGVQLVEEGHLLVEVGVGVRVAAVEDERGAVGDEGGGRLGRGEAAGGVGPGPGLAAQVELPQVVVGGGGGGEAAEDVEAVGHAARRVRVALRRREEHVRAVEAGPRDAAVLQAVQEGGLVEETQAVDYARPLRRDAADRRVVA